MKESIASIFVFLSGHFYQEIVARNEFFGHNQNYNCRCRGACKTDGSCGTNDDCLPPYFGFRCQYMNIASEALGTKTVVTDRNHATCNSPDVISMTLRFNISIRFSFLLLVLNPVPVLSLSYKRHNMTLSFKHNEEIIHCLHQETWEVSQDWSKVECWHQSIIFNEISLTGLGVRYVCEVYLSYGRNVAVNLKIHSIMLGQSLPKLAIDGLHDTCFVSDMNSHDQLLTVTIPSNLYTIYNIRVYPRTKMSWKHMVGFKLASEEPSGGRQIASFTEELFVYSVPINIANLHGVSLKEPLRDPMGSYLMTVCELELYGDCHKGRKVLDCAKNCTCVDNRCDDHGNCYICEMEVHHYHVCRQSCQHCIQSNEYDCARERYCQACQIGYKGKQCTQLCKNCGDTGECFQDTGQCAHSCYPGYSGDICDEPCGMCGGTGECDKFTGACKNKTCQPGYRGTRCTLRCSHCSGDGSCDWNTSRCIHGCQTGFRGDVCLLSCSKCSGDGGCGRYDAVCHNSCMNGYKGKDCSDSCSNCAGMGNCDRNTGHCISGCLPGFKGKHCSQRCKHCVNESCDPEKGTCKLGCIKGYYRPDCEQECANCAGDGGCDLATGNCINGCANGFYSPGCNDVCGNCAGDKSCDLMSGKCDTCKAGYTGDNCKEAESDPTSTGSVVTFYVTFLVIIGIIIFFLFCSQKIYMCFTLTSRESLDSSYKRKLKKSSTNTTKSETETVLSKDSQDDTEYM